MKKNSTKLKCKENEIKLMDNLEYNSERKR